MIRDPELWGLTDQAIATKVVTRMPFQHQAANWLYDHPFRMICCVGAPVVGAILHQQLKVPNLKLSQRIMHSRVFGQAAVISIAMTTMAFREYMDKRGRFPEPSI